MGMPPPCPPDDDLGPSVSGPDLPDSAAPPAWAMRLAHPSVVLPLALLLLFVALFVGCKDCEGLYRALEAARASGNATLIESAEAAWKASGCVVPESEPTPTPTTCPCGEYIGTDGQPICNQCPPVPVNRCADHPDLCVEGSVCVDTPMGPVCEPVPEPPPTAPVFPVRFPKAGVRVYANNHRYGNGLDGTPRVHGDPELGMILHHVATSDYHFDSDVWHGDSVLRGLYEMHVLGGARDGGLPVVPLGPVWQYKSGSERGRCHDDRESAAVSCDHFGNAATRDDPQTLAFEGLPAELGAQRDAFGPYAGFFTMPNCTRGRECSVRSCPPLAEGDDSACGPWTLVDWR